MHRIPATTTVAKAHAALRAKQYRAAPQRDARLFREHYTPAGRIPEQPNLTKEQADLLFAAAKGTGTEWSTLAAVAWLDSRWGDPSAGSLVGRRLTAAAWSKYGTDGDGDGTVDHANSADQARTVATYLGTARDSKGGALRAYFGGHNGKALTRRARFLADYFDALGPEAIVTGLEDPATRKALEDRILADPDVEIYEGGRGDIAAGLIDPRVLVSIEFLANRFGTVTVSCLISGHGVFTASGNVSLHSYGQAADIAALGGESILGHQQRGGRAYRAVKELLLLPDAMQSDELISLWDLGAPSFALADHDDHVHIGFTTVSDAAADDDKGSMGE
ncbi:MAG: Lytic transglycosylase catalytic [Thermoleophilia bacterium]|nr:Lytic transglycosylase catalytic [Thermoleophilia bacterium]